MTEIKSTSDQAPLAQLKMSDGCKAILERWELSASVCEDGQKVELHDWEGEYRVTVRRDIDSADLLVLLRYGNHMLDLGRKIGENHVKSSLRALIGAASEN